MSSYSTEEDNDPNINDYDTSDSSGFGDEDAKVIVLSKKQKQMLAFKTLVRRAKQNVNNAQFLDFQQDLKSINAAIMKNKWAKKTEKMPKFFVKHMCEIYHKIKTMDPQKEKNQKEQRALKALQKNFEKELRHFKQLEVFAKNASFWDGGDSDLGEEETISSDEASDGGNKLWEIQDPNEQPTETGSEDEGSEQKGSGGDEASGSEEESENEGSSWSTWEGDEQKQDDGVGQDEEESDEDKSDDGDEDKSEKWDALAGFEAEELAEMRKRSFWVKKTKQKKKKKPKKPKKPTKAKPDTSKGKPEKEESKAKVTAKDKDKQKHQKQWSVNRVAQVFQIVLVDRGKSSVNREVIVKQLVQLIDQCALHKAEQARMTVTSVLISFYFDTASRKTTGMSGARWRKTRALISSLLKSLVKNIDTLKMSNDADIRLILTDKDEESTNKDANETLAWMKALEGDDDKEEMNGEKKDKNAQSFDAAGGFSVINTTKRKKLDPNYQWIHGNLLSMIRKLTNQLWTNLKSLNGKPALYKKRLKNTELLMNIYKKCNFYFGKLGNKSLQSEIEVLAMSVIHNDYNEKLDILLDKPAQKKKKRKNKLKIKYNFKNKILDLPKCLIVSKAIFIFSNGTTRAQTQGMLYLIFAMAIHNRYELCRDLLLMSHLGSNRRIGSTNVELQILYNRALASFAICSFNRGNWYNTMIILQELFSSKQYKILLAQGFIRAPIDRSDTTQEMIKLAQLQQSRMLAQHFHINHDLLEAAHLLSSLFIEIPNMMHNTYESQGFIRNAYFRKVWHQYLRRDLRVPPESTKDFVLSTGIAMQNGEWHLCKAIIKKLKLWKSIKHPKYVIKRVFSTVKRECLRCYLYRYGSCYTSISLSKLSEMYGLSVEHCKQFISKLIITNHSNDIKFASFDELTHCIQMHQRPCMPIQRTALEYSDKLSFLIEQNEKLVGIYSRYSGFGGNANKFNKSKGKFGDKDGKYDKGKRGKGGKGWAQNNKAGNKAGKYDKNSKSKYGQNRTQNRGGRFNRHSSNDNSLSKSGGNQSGGNRQFGYKQNVRTQLRSVRPNRT